MRHDRLLTRPFLLCALANALQSLAWNLYLHLPGFLHDQGASEVEIGVISAASAVAAIAARPPLATWLDRGSRVRIARTAAAFDAVVCALHLTVTDLGPWIYALRIAHGLAEAALFTTLFTIAADLVPPARRTEGLALYSASGMLPIAIGGVLGDAILASHPYATLFGVSAALAAAAFAASLAVPDRRQATAPGAPRSGGFLAALAQRDLAPLWMIGAVFGVALAGVFTFVKRYAMETEVASVGAFFSAYVGAAIAVRLLGGSVPDRVGPRRLLPVALALLAAGIGFLALATSERTVLASGLLCGVGHGFAYPMLSSLVVARAREHERGAAISVLTSLPDVGALVGAPLAGAILEATGFATMFAVSAAVLAAGTVLFALWDRR